MNTKIKLFQVSVALLVSGIIATPAQAADKIVYPIQEISKLECRFQDFDTLSSSCKQNLPILETKDYKKYIKQNDGYNDFTRIYTVLWGASYKYGWDQGNGGHQWLDIATAKGTPVYSVADGIVIVARNDIGWGNVVSIEHKINGKTIVSDYAHLSKFSVKKGDKVRAGDKIGEVGSTGNSTGNHLHFQIDLKSPFYPYYYDSRACPYSYYDITENGVCFDELSAHTIDPVLFLETNGAIVEKIVETPTKTTNTVATTTKSNTITTNSIFYTYVYKDSPESHVEEVQNIYRELGAYKGRITGDYDDVEESIIQYQIDRGVIENRSSLGAGYFGPKTRAQTKLDYDAYLAKGSTPRTTTVASTTSNSDTSSSAANIQVEKISKVGLLSREEIEKREIDEFLKFNTISFKNTSRLNEVEVGKTTKFTVEVETHKGRAYRGTTPGSITLSIDEGIAKAFPKEFFYFAKGERDISITWVKKGTTTLTIKLGDRVLKTITVRVNTASAKQSTVQKQSLWVQAGTLIASSSIVTGEEKTGIVLFRDNYGTALFNKRYEGQFAINSESNVLYCVKKGSLNNIRTIYNRDCKDTEYQEHLVFDYDDTVAGLLIFDYKVYDKGTKLELVDISKKKTLSAKNLTVTAPKGLYSSYKYYDEIVSTLESWVTDGVQRGYFLEEKNLSEYDANIWIKNALTEAKEKTSDITTKGKISQKILQISTNLWSTRKDITREEFLDKALEYLVLDDSLIWNGSIDYRDLEPDQDRKASVLFNQNTTWKDKFGKSYFQPESYITRWEWAYLVALAIEANQKVFLAAR